MPKLNAEQEAVLEQKTTQLAPWLGGYFEAGGSLRFSIVSKTVKGTKYTYAYPMVSTTDKDPNVSSGFKEMFGGITYPDAYSSFVWRADQIRAQIMAMSLAPYAPSRREFMTALSNWINSDPEERLQIARDIQGHDRNSTVSRHKYEPLVTNPIFLAGVVDSRGNFLSQQNQGKRTRYARLDVTSSNTSLLEALEQQYGGHIAITGHSGDSRIIRGRVSKFSRDNVRWTPSVTKTEELFNLVVPHLQFKVTRAQEVLAART